jgi:HlyD family secretion protein
MTRAQCLAAIVSLCAFTAACHTAKKEDKAEPVVPVQAADVKQESIERFVTADAILYPKEQAGVTPKISAPVKKFYVNRGDHVAAGQLLAVLENRDLVAAAADNKGQYEQAQATYKTTTAATVPEEVTKAQQDATSTKQAMDAAQKVFESRQQLLREGAIARRLVEEANVAYVQARSAYEVAQKHLQSVENVNRHEEVRGAEGQLQSAQARYQGAQAQVAYSEIRSPIAGVVTDRPLYAGEMASAGTAVITVMDVRRVVARANVPVAQALHLKVGSSATITQTDGDLQATGNVTVVSAAVDANTTTVEVWVEAPNGGERLHPGATVRVSIHAETIPDAVVIPAPALLSSADGGSSVMVIGSDSVAHERKVQTGVRQGDKVQVVGGLKPGERVVTVGGLGLQDGTKVTLKAPEEDKKDDKEAGEK